MLNRKEVRPRSTDFRSPHPLRSLSCPCPSAMAALPTTLQVSVWATSYLFCPHLTTKWARVVNIARERKTRDLSPGLSSRKSHWRISCARSDTLCTKCKYSGVHSHWLRRLFPQFKTWFTWGWRLILSFTSNYLLFLWYISMICVFLRVWSIYCYCSHRRVTFNAIGGTTEFRLLIDKWNLSKRQADRSISSSRPRSENAKKNMRTQRYFVL